MRRKAHVRCGKRSGETHRRKHRQGAPDRLSLQPPTHPEGPGLAQPGRVRGRSPRGRADRGGLHALGPARAASPRAPRGQAGRAPRLAAHPGPARGHGCGRRPAQRRSRTAPGLDPTLGNPPGTANRYRRTGTPIRANPDKNEREHVNGLGSPKTLGKLTPHHPPPSRLNSTHSARPHSPSPGGRCRTNRLNPAEHVSPATHHAHLEPPQHTLIAPLTPLERQNRPRSRRCDSTDTAPPPMRARAPATAAPNRAQSPSARTISPDPGRDHRRNAPPGITPATSPATTLQPAHDHTRRKRSSTFS